MSERALFRLHAAEGLPVVTLRPPFIYGPENPFYREAFFWDRMRADRAHHRARRRQPPDAVRLREGSGVGVPEGDDRAGGRRSGI